MLAAIVSMLPWQLMTSLLVTRSFAHTPCNTMAQCEWEYGKPVYTTLLTVNENTVIDEGPFCSCSACTSPSVWKYDRHALTWYHHERIDMKVQFRSCVPLVGAELGECSGDEAEGDGAVVRVGLERWQPYVLRVTCRCPEHIYYMDSWRLILDPKKIPLYWDYSFVCFRPICREDHVCGKYYVDPTSMETAGYSFTCSCPTGLMCPATKFDKLKSFDLDGTDTKGGFMLLRCQQIPGWQMTSVPDTMTSR